jgi:2-octaprenyl-6-methoxyphenol hydroxylase
MPARIVIAGGGLAGLALGLALKQALAGSFEVVVADPALAARRRDDRAYAISAAGQRMFAALGVWDAIAGAVQPINAMVVTDSHTRDVVRPVYLTFASEAEGGERSAGGPVAHMVWSRAVDAALLDACREAGVILRAEAVTGEHAEQARVVARLSSGAEIGAQLLVAADGARSAIRERAGIGWVGWSYEQSGIVATIGHERDHEGRAIEHFLPSGPFAILPLPKRSEGGFQSSIVWTERSGDVAALLGLDEIDLRDEIESRFGLQLGEIILLSRPVAYPLSFGVARSFIGSRLALVGDAAHVIHPIAGQGLNLGLKDIAALAQTVVEAARLGLDVGTPAALAPYQAARRFDTLAMGAMTDGLNRLFSNDLAPVRLARDLGLGLVDRMPALKGFFMREAAGANPGLPRLMRGESL